MDATWTYSSHHKWTLGYSFEVVVTTGKTGAVWPLLASADPASFHPQRTFPPKISQLPASTRYVVADAGYDSNQIAEAIEYDSDDQRTGRRMLCPYSENRRGTKSSPHKETRKRKKHRERRKARYEFFRRPFAQRLIKRRGACVEPFNDWFKTRFDLHNRAWHKGLANNQTQILAGIFAYQLLLFYNHACGNNNGCIQWILDTL